MSRCPPTPRKSFEDRNWNLTAQKPASDARQMSSLAVLIHPLWLRPISAMVKSSVALGSKSKGELICRSIETKESERGRDRVGCQYQYRGSR